MCGSCVAKASPILNEKLGEIGTPIKMLSITSENLDEKRAIEAVEEAGYKAKNYHKAELLSQASYLPRLSS